MPIQSFRSFEAFMSANRHANVRPMVLGRDRGSWALSHLMLDNVSVQWGEAGGKAVIEGASRLGGLTIFLQTRGTPAFSGNGRRLDDLSLMVAQPDDEFCLAADGGSRRWCSLYIPNGNLVSQSGDTARPVGSMRGVFQVHPQRMEGFRSVMEQLDQAVQHAPATFESVVAQQVAKQKLVLEVRHLLSEPHEPERQIGRPVVPRKEIIRMSLEFVDRHAGEYLSVDQVAAAAGVSERTLRDAFQHHFGVGPVRYLNLRTLHQIRGLLKAADPSRATVAGIAARFGVWHFGRLAQDYRFLFGELPSQTLRRLP